MLKYDDQNSENFTVSDKKITMDLGEVRKIDYLRPSSRISWISSNPDSVQVDINGYLFAISSGKSVITGYYNGKKHKISVSVKRRKEKGALNTIEKNTSVGKKVSFPRISRIDKSKITISSNNSDVIRVDSSKNKLVAVGEGQAIISYSYDYSDKDGENKGNGNIIYNVEKPQVEDSSLSIGVGETRKIKIDGLAGGKQLWKSSNKNTEVITYEKYFDCVLFP